jgi:hypothetical protein
LLGKIIVFALVSATLAFFIYGVWLGRRALRDGSGDRKGGARLAIYIFVALMIAWVFRTHHYGANELDLIQIGIQFALLPTVLLWLFYLALEPYVRRWWPHRMVSWSRLLAGDFLDPLIGRDILIGAVLGMAMMVVNNLWALAPGWFGRPQAPRPIKLYTLLGLRESVGELFFSGVTLIVFLAVTCMFLLLLLHIIFRRREWLAWRSLAAVHLCRLLKHPAAQDQSGFLGFIFGADYPRGHPVWPADANSGAVLFLAVGFAFYTSLGGQKVFQDRQPAQL